MVAKLLRLLAPHYTQSGIIPRMLRQTFAKSTDVLGKNTDFNYIYIYIFFFGGAATRRVSWPPHS